MQVCTIWLYVSTVRSRNLKRSCTNLCLRLLLSQIQPKLKASQKIIYSLIIMLTIVGIKNCSTIKKTLTWLDENEQEYTFRDVKKEPLDESEIADLVKKVGLETLVNKRGMKWRTLELNKREVSDEELLELVFEHQTMIKRPVVLSGEAAMVGFDEEALESFIEYNEG